VCGRRVKKERKMEMEKAYKKECYSTLIAFIVVTLLTHVFPMYFLFPGLIQMTIFGFPAHYFLTLVLGWIVLMPLYWIYIQISEKIDQEISDLSGRAAELEEVRVYTAAQAKGGPK
jgi:putative solute:sodium symporter small subunit